MINNFPVWALVLIIIGCLVAGFIGGFFVARAIISKQIKDNPPINHDMVKQMYRSMGRTPSEAQINATLRAVNQASNNSKKKRK